jgi:hypothetical protein
VVILGDVMARVGFAWRGFVCLQPLRGFVVPGGVPVGWLALLDVPIVGAAAVIGEIRTPRDGRRVILGAMSA